MTLSALMAIAGRASAQVLPDYSAFPQSSLSLGVGTQGLDVQGNYSFARMFNARIGYNSMPFSFEYNGRQAVFNRNSVFAIADWQPEYGGGSWFERKWFISAGIAYYLDNSVYRQGIGSLPDYTIYMAKLRPYFGTGLGNIPLSHTLSLHFDLGYFIPLQAPTSTYDDKADKVRDGLRALLPGLNAGAGISIKL